MIATPIVPFMPIRPIQRPKPKKDRWFSKLILPSWAETKFALPIRVRIWQGNGS